MTGSFNSHEQSIADSNYFNISLHMYPIWEEKEGHWLYVEQAMYSRQDQPYRQRIYQLEKLEDNLFVSHVYLIADEENAVGKWKEPTHFKTLTMDNIIKKEGCEVILNKMDDGSFRGSTMDQKCKSTLRGASYASSIVQIQPDKLISWDQGFSSDHKQVWGATKGGYIFVKEQ